ncbi:MAG: NAD(P)/FAD-dependent oxidoreductase, partial [Cyanobacteriota bacterium]|nr:NAD(P)/FAD-dependent oxidoreductase [Cyanobacteriota bacterium]
MSRKTGIPADELLEMADRRGAQEFRIRRRRFLQGGLALTAAMAANAFPREGQRARAQTTPVLIVGAGIAGLTAAYRLSQAGVPVNVIEAKNRVGGRMQTLQKALSTPSIAELGAEFIDTDHVCMRGLAEELGFELVDLLAVEETLAVQDNYFFEGRRVPIAEIIRDYAPVAEQIDADLEAIDEFEDYTTPFPAVVELDNTSLSDYLDRIPNTTNTVRQIIKVAYSTEYGLDPEEQSALNLLYLIGTEPEEFEILGTSDERFHVRGGNQQILERLAQLVAGPVETGTVLEAIDSLPDGRYRVAVRSGTQRSDRFYERILLTLPFTTLREVRLDVDLPPLKAAAINNLRYATNAKIITGYNEKIWRTRYNSRANTYSDSSSYTNIWENAPSRYALPGQGLITNFLGGTKGVAVGSATPQAHGDRLNFELERLFPGISAAAIPFQALRAYWPGEPFTRGSYLCYAPGDWTRFYGIEGERVGNIFFAGEHTSLEYQGWMEGGCESGELAATEILEDLGLTASSQALR